ncbi:activity-dependent neuroprotector homeobox protein 2-like [Amblyraja radiata]|uniref:activity-dependent neuroprotector homeobox protein 2-like n=1 Tax=Amblyraja radiata TaxID=386614 RepID=UPI001401FB71|nr:activity-dependent neuroprotector homeobox protein 2-like [Amblyraja radiata]XP_032869935.1 activity-dependent neuroprotector homeobox protein 2-like [Amblyraja radiata]XP_032869945.1 activity-dependent neuroprotector homeobox protein 2-like [Amblyraja radiata]
MYQLPVTNLEILRKSRKKVKRILSDIGLQCCKELLEEFKSYHPGDYYMKNTTWSDLSKWHSNKKSKVHPYRTKPFCCSLCDFSTKFINAYKSHMRCYHEDEMDMEMLVGCPNCTFTAHPKLMKKHGRIFHLDTRRAHGAANHDIDDQVGGKTQPKTYQGKMPNLVKPVYYCRVCSYKDVSVYGIKKHVFLSHFGSFVNNYTGQIVDQVDLLVYNYFCKGCHVKMATHDALLYHVLEKHKEVDGPVRAMVGHISELKPRPHIAPKPQTSKTSALSPCSIRLAGQMLSGPRAAGSALSIRLKGPMLTCVKKAASMANTTPSLPVISSVVSPIAAPVPAQRSLNVLALPPNFSPVSLGSMTPALNAFHTVPSSLIPVTSSGGLPKPGQVNLVPATFQMSQSNLAIRAAGPVLPRAFLMQQGLTIDRAVRPSIPGNGLSANLPTVKHLIQSRKDANGLPAYTLTPVQFALPVAPTATSSSNKLGVLSAMQMPLHIDRTNCKALSVPRQPREEPSVIAVAAVEREPAQSMLAVALNLPPAPVPRAQQWKSCSLCSSLLPLSAYDNHLATAHRANNNRPEKVVACANYLQRAGAHICKCLFCECYVHENLLFCHLLMHGLTCLFCSQTFHDLAKFTAHTKSSHAGLRFEVVENGKDGASASKQINEGGFNLTITLPEDEMGPNDIHLTLIPSKMSSPHAPFVIEVCRHKAEEVDIIAQAVTPGPPSSECPFCRNHFRGSKYEKHLHEKHHVAPILHPLLKIPSFKCIYCLGVYTDHMAASTISLHLFRCRGLNKMQTVTLPKDTGLSKRAISEIGELGAELVSNGDGRNLAPPASKRLKTDVATAYSEVPPLAQSNTANTSHSLPSSDPSTVLALVPKGFGHRPNKERKLFLNDYFHKQPYPSNKEIDLLSSVLSLKKNDVALVFDTKRGSCLKAMKDKPFVLLGFNMSELKKVKHGLRFDFGGTSRKSNRS